MFLISLQPVNCLAPVASVGCGRAGRNLSDDRSVIVHLRGRGRSRQVCREYMVIGGQVSCK